MWKLLLLTLLVPIAVSSQEVSKRINLSERTDLFDSIESIDSLLIVKTGNLVRNGCVKDPVGLGHGAVLRLEMDGEIIKQVETIRCDSSFFYAFSLNSSLFIASKQKSIAAYGDVLGSPNIRIMEYVHREDSLYIHKILGEEGKRNVPLTIDQIGKHYFMLVNTERGMYELWKLNADFEIAKRELVHEGFTYRNNTSVSRNGNLLVTIARQVDSDACIIVLKEYNTELKLMNEYQYDNNVGVYTFPTVIQTKDDGFITSWAVNYPERFDIIIHGIHGDTFSMQPTISKFNEDFELEWEYFLMESHWTEMLTFKDVGGGEYLASGYSEEYANIYPGEHRLEDAPRGYTFLINDHGELLWRRYITDLRSNSWNAAFWDGCTVPGGYALVGVIDTIKDVPDPYINDPAGWLVTLDENGCWNGNCNDYIMILDDSTSKTLKFDTVTSTIETVPQENTEFKVYPNPTSSVVTLEFDDFKKRIVTLINMEGKTLRTIQSHSPKVILQIGGYPPGMYILSVKDEYGRVEGKQKVIVR